MTIPHQNPAAQRALDDIAFRVIVKCLRDHLALVKFFKGPAIGFPLLGIAIRFHFPKKRGFGIWIDRTSYKPQTCFGFWWVVEMDRVEIPKTAFWAAHVRRNVSANRSPDE